jgi:hypothetical protein
VSLAWYVSIWFFPYIELFGREVGPWVFAGLFLCIMVVASLVAWASLRHLHPGALCVKCAEDIPLDGARRAARTRTALQLILGYHLFSQLLGPLLLLAATILSIVAIFVPGPTLAIISFSIITGYLFINGVCAAKHRVLRAWCPICRDDGGWNDIGGPIKDPDPSLTKAL